MRRHDKLGQVLYSRYWSLHSKEFTVKILFFLILTFCFLHANFLIAGESNKPTNSNRTFDVPLVPDTGTLENRFDYTIIPPEYPDPNKFQTYWMKITGRRSQETGVQPGRLPYSCLDRAAIYVAVPEHAIVDYTGSHATKGITAEIADNWTMKNYPPKDADFQPLQGKNIFIEQGHYFFLGFVPYTGPLVAGAKMLESFFVPEKGRTPPKGSIFSNLNDYDVISFGWEKDFIAKGSFVYAFRCGIPIKFVERKGSVTFYVWLYDRGNYTLGPIAVNPWVGQAEEIRKGPPPMLLIPSYIAWATKGGGSDSWRTILSELGIGFKYADLAYLDRLIPDSTLTGVVATGAIDEIITQLKRHGGRVVLFPQNWHSSSLAGYCGISVNTEKGMVQRLGKKLMCEGENLCRIWKGLQLANDYAPEKWFQIEDEEGKVLTYVRSESSNERRITSVHMIVGQGELLLLSSPLNHLFKDSNFDLLDNKKACERLSLWLAGKIEYPGKRQK